MDEIVRCERDWSVFDRASLLSRVNSRAAGEAVPVDRQLMALLRVCADVHRASDGAFDPTVGSLMREFGFHTEDPPKIPPEARERAVGLEHVLLDHAACTVRFARPGIRLDLGAIGKGAALDRAGAVLVEHDVRNALLHGGTSTVLGMGDDPSREPGAGWRVALRLPGRDERDLPVVALRDEALSLSAPHGRMIGEGAAAAGHILDPVRGRSAMGVRCAAVVVRMSRGDAGALSDAWSTALVVDPGLGPRLPADMAWAVASERGPGHAGAHAWEVPRGVGRWTGLCGTLCVRA